MHYLGCNGDSLAGTEFWHSLPLMGNYIYSHLKCTTVAKKEQMRRPSTTWKHGYSQHGGTYKNTERWWEGVHFDRAVAKADGADNVLKAQIGGKCGVVGVGVES